MNLQQALSLVDELRKRIETLEEHDCLLSKLREQIQTLEKGTCLIGAKQARMEALENDAYKRARCFGNEHLDSLEKRILSIEQTLDIPSGDDFRMIDDAKLGEFK